MTAFYWIVGVIALALLIYLVCRFAQTGEVLMTSNGWLQILCLFVVLVLLVKPLGLYMAKVFPGRTHFSQPGSGPIRAAGSIAWRGSMPRTRWIGKSYSVACCSSALVGFIFLYLLQRLQGFLPLNPQGMGAVSPTRP